MLLYSELLQSSRLDPPVVKPIYEHLHRIGLEQYAVIFEYHNITTEAALVGMKLEELEKMAVELVYDPMARGLLTQLLDSSSSGSSGGFIGECYALAEVSFIRESFLAAYSHIITSSSSTAAITNTATDDESVSTTISNTHNPNNTTQYPPSSTTTSATIDTIMETATTEVDMNIPTALTEHELRELSKVFCNILSCSGRGVISLYNLQRLLSTHPHRPVQCIKAAREFIRPRYHNSNTTTGTNADSTTNNDNNTTSIETTTTPTTSIETMKYFTLYTFLKRAGLQNDIHTVLTADINTVDKLLELGKDSKLADVICNIRKLFKFDHNKGFRLGEIITKTNSFSGNLMNFSLFPSYRILSMFVLFYTMGSDHFTMNTKYNFYNTTDANASTSNSSCNNSINNDKNTDIYDEEMVEVTDTSISGTASVESKSPSITTTKSITTTIITTNTTAASTTPITTIPTTTTESISRAPISCMELEKLAYKFSILTSDSKGTAVVSMLEVLDHLYKYPTNPTLAVETALTELVHPAYPIEPIILPIIPAPLEWVDEWLKSADGSNLSQYAVKFKEQGFIEKSDFLVGGLLSLEELEKSIGVSILAHRKRIVEMHRKPLLLSDASPSTMQ